MTKQRIFSIVATLSILMLASCGGKKPEEQPAETTAEAPPTPIDQATVGSVAGKVSFQGAKPKQARIMMDQDPVCVGKHSGAVFAEDGEVNGNGTLPNVFVYVKEGAEKYTFATPAEQMVLDQNGCMYKPHVVGIMVGQDLHIISSDPTTHNIHPQPQDNQEWNMGGSDRQEVCPRGNHDSGEVQPASLDESLHRRHEESLLCRDGKRRGVHHQGTSSR
jgi:plastocyanin